MLGGIDGGGRGREIGVGGEAGAVSTRQDGLLGETREELFMVNLHINDSLLPLMIPLLHAENKMCRQLVGRVGNGAFVGLHESTYVCMRGRGRQVRVHRVSSFVCAFNCLTAGRCQRMFCLFPA